MWVRLFCQSSISPEREGGFGKHRVETSEAFPEKITEQEGGVRKYIWSRENLLKFISGQEDGFRKYLREEKAFRNILSNNKVFFGKYLVGDKCLPKYTTEQRGGFRKNLWSKIEPSENRNVRDSFFNPLTVRVENARALNKNDRAHPRATTRIFKRNWDKWAFYEAHRTNL